MEGPQELPIKQETDTDVWVDKVLQFKLVLPRIDMDKPLGPDRPSTRLKFVDLTLSPSSDDEEDEEEEGSSRTTTTSNCSVPIERVSNDIEAIESEMERVHGLDITEPTQNLSQDTSATSAEENGMDSSTSDAEIQQPSFKSKKISKSLWPHGHGEGRTLPYTNEQKRIALQGNPKFDYRTKLGKKGEETYAIHKCHKCPTGFPRMHHYLIHMKGHSNANKNFNYPCKECDFRCVNSQLLAHHMERHRLQREPHTFVNMCGRSCGAAGASMAQKRRVESASPKRIVKQRVSRSPTGRSSSASFTRSSGIGIHTPIKAEGLEEAQRAEARKGNPHIAYRISKRYRPNGEVYQRATYKCQQCPFNHESYEIYKKHMQGHIGHREFQCKLCTYSVSSNVNLTRHLKIHRNREQPRVSKDPRTAEKPTICRRRRTFPSRDWMPANSGVKKIRRHSFPTSTVFSSMHCPKCPSKFTGTANLETHLKQHGRAGMKLHCPNCDYSSNREDYMRSHVTLHAEPHEANVQKAVATREEAAVIPEADTPISLAPPTDAGTMSRNESGEFFISYIRIQNVTMMNEAPTVADISTHGILKLTGQSEEGKSSYILAVMLGLGYDLCLDNRDQTTSICGLNLQNVVSNGKEFASIELTLSLRAFPELQKEFGSQLQFSRRITRMPSELSDVLVISSADPRPEFTNARTRVLGGKDLQLFLGRLKLTPQRMRLMLLNEENVTYMVNDTDLWFELFVNAVDESTAEIGQQIQEVKFLLQRIDGELVSEQTRLELFKTRLQEPLPMDSERMRQAKEEDLVKHNTCAEGINKLVVERSKLRKRMEHFVVLTNDGTQGFVLKMRIIFKRFLQALEFTGEIRVSYKTKELSICIWKLDSEEAPPETMTEVKSIWRGMSNGKRRIAVMALYLALWEISPYLELLAVDAFSCTVADFHIPPPCLPVLSELLNRRCLEHKQCMISVPLDH